MRGMEAHAGAAASMLESPLAPDDAVLLSGEKHDAAGEWSLLDFELRTKLGHGAFGVVYEAAVCAQSLVKAEQRHWPLVNACVALKVIPRHPQSAGRTPSRTKDVEQYEYARRVQEEIDIHSVIPPHPNVVSYLASFQDETSIYLVLELCSGGSVQSYLDALLPPVRTHQLQPNHDTETERQLANYWRDLVSGVAFLHRCCVVHRDLKLSNLLIDHQGTLKIADFGSAAFLYSSQDRRFTLVGTPGYISPEIRDGYGHGFGCDLYSIGCVLHALWTRGEPPSETDAQYTIQVALPGSVRSTMCALLQPDAAQRPTAEQLLCELEPSRNGHQKHVKVPLRDVTADVANTQNRNSSTATRDTQSCSSIDPTAVRLGSDGVVAIPGLGWASRLKRGDIWLGIDGPMAVSVVVSANGKYMTFFAGADVDAHGVPVWIPELDTRFRIRDLLCCPDAPLREFVSQRLKAVKLFSRNLTYQLSTDERS
ncbi:Serine/threonine-protein kinase PLK4 [Porphyridium purpureum]|uniref:Serine/threonine-protein kinase PLK4 n=1 Tax=Porphyridium purpureum TaxID=35688 RepID=A0A5J4YQA5_PORPP|nr:Serine/threonine-protein kinase PLK4 [Porphyridium purpureum]|eukprot:POR6101..scf236_6